MRGWIIKSVTMQQSTPELTEIFQNITQSFVNMLLIFLTAREEKIYPLCPTVLTIVHYWSCVSESTDTSARFHLTHLQVPLCNRTALELPVLQFIALS
jgi:hypothetical protein